MTRGWSAASATRGAAPLCDDVAMMCDPTRGPQKGVDVKGRVLVVDDDLALAEMLGIVLRNEGLEVTHVADGGDAVPAFREARPDLVLLDVMLPGLDGMEVCRRIRAESGVPIVMLTARTDTVDVVVGLESGADDYVVKPFKPQELIARVRADFAEATSLRRRSWRSVISRSTSPAIRSSGTGRPCPRRPSSSTCSSRSRASRGRSSPVRCCSSRVGVSPRGRHPSRQRPRPAAALEDRARS